MDDITVTIEDLLLKQSSRGIEKARSGLPRGYCRRAAQLIIDNPGTVLIGSGFWVAGTYETDGPIGALALFQVLEKLNYRPIFVCAPPLYHVLKNDWTACEFPIRDQTESQAIARALLNKLNPSLIISIERPGIAADGKYYNMRREDITNHIARLDNLMEWCQCPTIGIGDGGNEIGMGNVLPWLKDLDIIPSITRVDELVIARVSNWGVYGILAEMSRLIHQDLLTEFDPVQIAQYLVNHGSVDGITRQSSLTEDGLPLTVGLDIIHSLRRLIQ